MAPYGPNFARYPGWHGELPAFGSFEARQLKLYDFNLIPPVVSCDDFRLVRPPVVSCDSLLEKPLDEEFCRDLKRFDFKLGD